MSKIFLELFFIPTRCGHLLQESYKIPILILEYSDNKYKAQENGKGVLSSIK